MRVFAVLGVAVVLGIVVPGWRASGAEQKSSICASDAISVGGSLAGAGTAAWLIARARLGPVGATVSGLASEKLGGAMAPALCSFLSQQLADDARAAGSAAAYPWTVPMARLPIDARSEPESRLLLPPGLERRTPGLLIDLPPALSHPVEPPPIGADGKPDFEAALIRDMVRRTLEPGRGATLSRSLGGSEAARALGDCLSCRLDATRSLTAPGVSEAVGKALLSPGLAGRPPASLTGSGLTIELAPAKTSPPPR